MRGGARANAQYIYFPYYSIDSVVERLETKEVTCTQLSSCSQAYVDFKWVCFSCQFRQICIRTSTLEPLKFASHSDKKYN